MAGTLNALIDHLERHDGRAKLVVWAHNSHLGDARATELGTSGELNVGQLVRDRFGREAVLVGLMTYAGTVTAATDWDRPARRRRVRPAVPGSVEALCHEAGEGGSADFMLLLRDDRRLAERLTEPRLERAIGVVYRPETERFSHYFHAKLAEQFDAVLHFDQTEAVEPLDRDAGWEEPDELPETFPFGE
jgi:erythromycin esterase-like protein